MRPTSAPDGRASRRRRMLTVFAAGHLAKPERHQDWLLTLNKAAIFFFGLMLTDTLPWAGADLAAASQAGCISEAVAAS